MSGLVVGQELFWAGAGNYRGRNYSVTVTKVGRKWAELSNRHRIDLETMIADGKEYTSPGRCWVTETHYAATVLTGNAFTNLKNKMAFRPADGVTIQDIYEAAKLLRIEL
jgi:hypothetical protein